MLQLEPRGGVDGLVTAPLKRATVGARDHEAVQYGHEHRAFDIEVMAAGGEQLAHDLLAGGLTPQAFEDECRADRDDRGVGRIVCIYEVDAILVGQSITLRYDPQAPASRPLQVRHDGRPAGLATRLDAYANTAVKRDRSSWHAQPDDPAPEPRPSPLAMQKLKEKK